MTTTPQAALLSESEIVVCIAKAGCIGTVKMSYESGPYDIYRPSINASRLYDAIEAAIIAKLQATQEPVQAGELPDEREAFIHWMTTTYPDVYTQDKAEHYWVQEHVSRLAWQAATARAALSARKPLTDEQRGKAYREVRDLLKLQMDYQSFSLGCDCTERAHGIGLEVKP